MVKLTDKNFGGLIKVGLCDVKLRLDVLHKIDG